MYLRFTTTIIDEDSHRAEGVFVAAYALLDSGLLEAGEWSRLRELLDWFNKYLPHPPEKFAANRAIFWFRSDALSCIEKVWELVHILRANDYHVVVSKCRRLANIAYRDQLQVAAYPSDHDGKITMN